MKARAAPAAGSSRTLAARRGVRPSSDGTRYRASSVNLPATPRGAIRRGGRLIYRKPFDRTDEACAHRRLERAVRGADVLVRRGIAPSAGSVRDDPVLLLAGQGAEGYRRVP
jgi:hypothetical protein